MNQKKPTILILDDEEIICLNLGVFLEEEGYEVLSSGSGEEALEILNKYPVQLVVVDVRLPGMDGNAFVREAHSRFPQLHFLIHTGSNQYIIPADLSKMGICEADVLLKPLMDMQVLTQAIARVMSRHSQTTTMPMGHH
jgi:two-component system, OmpR family, response regulator